MEKNDGLGFGLLRESLIKFSTISAKTANNAADCLLDKRRREMEKAKTMADPSSSMLL